MLYLSDVSSENGPFEYLENSNKALSLIDMTINFGLEHSQNRLTHKIVSEKILRKKRYKSVDFKAKKGTLILFNSFGIHRGKPLNSGNRYALTNYYFPKVYIQKNIQYLTEKNLNYQMRNKTYIIAEIGNTHEGSVGLAKQFIKSAKDCGVDAVKLQTHIFSAESLDDAPNPPYFKDETRKEYFEKNSF